MCLYIIFHYFIFLFKFHFIFINLIIIYLFFIVLYLFTLFILIRLVCVYVSCKSQENHVDAEEIGRKTVVDSNIVLQYEMILLDGLKFH